MQIPYPRPFLWLALFSVLTATLWFTIPAESPAPLAATAPAWLARQPAVALAGVARKASREQTRLAKASRIRPVAGNLDLRLAVGERVDLPLFDGISIAGVINLVRPQPTGALVAGGRLDDGGTFTLARNPRGGWSGTVLPQGDGPAYRLAPADDGGLLLAELPRNAVICANLPVGPRPASGVARISSSSGGGGVQAIEVPLLDSRPDADAVIYLDFDGEVVNDPGWNGGETIVATDSGLSAADIERVWRRVAEDYRPFRITVTTDPARYAAARPMQRMRCIITSSSEWFEPVGGVALLASWTEAGVEDVAADTPCWAFSNENFYFADNIALAVSHEIGHTLWLYHDGVQDELEQLVEEYYDGHDDGTVSWGPIMGAPYGRAVIQWNAGDYSGANNFEDDIAIIGGIDNHTGFAPERRGATLAEAGRLSVSVDGTTVAHDGLIERSGEESWLLLAAGAGPLSLRLAPADATDPDTDNFDGSLTLTTLSGTVLATADVPDGLYPELNTTVSAGVYVLKVRSVGQGDPLGGGYSEYGSIGHFRIEGTVTDPDGIAPVLGGAFRAEGRVGNPFLYVIEAAGVGLAYDVIGLPEGLSVGLDGVVSGVPVAAGVFEVTALVSSSTGLQARAVEFAIAEDSLADALDAPARTFVTGGDRGWRPVAEPGNPTGGSAARSGEVLDGWQQSWIETTLTGPGQLTWHWKVSSEEDYDFYYAELDGTPVAVISGDQSWSEDTLTVPAGVHTVRWSFDKDPYLAKGEDSAWLDGVSWVRGYELWTEAAMFTGESARESADPDGDGVVNLLEYALGLDPDTSDGFGQSVVVSPSVEPGVEGALEIAFDRPDPRDDLRYVVEVSADLITWERGHAYSPLDVNGAGLPTVEVSRIALPGGGERITVRDASAPGESAPRRFIRLRVERT